MNALLFALALAAADPTAIAVTPDAVAWKEAPPTLPKGVQVAVLEGDPAKDGLVTMRLKVPKGFRLGRHTHPADERVTVLEGTMKVTYGDKDTKTFPTGSYYVTPKGIEHNVAADDGALIQITVQGPWRVDFVKPPKP